jgi:hypothetical protein
LHDLLNPLDPLTYSKSDFQIFFSLKRQELVVYYDGYSNMPSCDRIFQIKVRFMDYKQAILKEIETLPAEMLPQIHRLLHDVREQRLSVQQILARADQIAAERKAWTREQHVKRLLEVAEEIRQEAMTKGVALDRDEDAAVESASPRLFVNN